MIDVRDISGRLVGRANPYLAGTRIRARDRNTGVIGQFVPRTWTPAAETFGKPCLLTDNPSVCHLLPDFEPAIESCIETESPPAAQVDSTGKGAVQTAKGPNAGSGVAAGETAPFERAGPPTPRARSALVFED